MMLSLRAPAQRLVASWPRQSTSPRKRPTACDYRLFSREYAACTSRPLHRWVVKPRAPVTLFRPSGVRVVRSGGSIRFSTAPVSAYSKAEDKDASDDGNTKKNKGRDDDSNLFLDNIGKIFLAVIGGVVLMLVRSSRGTTNKTALRDRIETFSALDPLEIDDLRVANSDLTPEVWRDIAEEAYAAFPSGRASYVDFVSVVIQAMRRLKGGAFTVQLGHLLDRVVIAAIEETAGEDKSEAALRSLEEDGDPTRRSLPLPLLFAILSLSLNSDAKARVGVLFEVMKRSSSLGEEDKVSEADIIRMVGYLQTTCQLVPDAQIVLSDVKYPVQQYRKGKPSELVAGAKKTMKEEGTKDVEGADCDKYDVTDFHRLLRTKSVCAWGECYVKKRGLD